MWDDPYTNRLNYEIEESRNENGERIRNMGIWMSGGSGIVEAGNENFIWRPWIMRAMVQEKLPSGFIGFQNEQTLRNFAIESRNIHGRLISGRIPP